MTNTSNTTIHQSDLSGRTALVTGAGTGIGAATAIALAAAGAQVALLGRREDKLSAVADQIASAATGSAAGTAIAVADVTDADTLTTAIGTARDQLGGRFDLVCANAGAMLAAPIETAKTAEWDRMINVNITGLLTTVRATIDDLLAAAGAGRPADLVLTSSIGAHLVLPGYAVYTATKAAVTHLATNLRAEFGPSGVRVRAIEPGMTESELGLDMADQESLQFLAGFKQDIPPIPAADIAEAIRWSATMPSRMNVASMIVLPTIQG